MNLECKGCRQPLGVNPPDHGLCWRCALVPVSQLRTVMEATKRIRVSWIHHDLAKPLVDAIRVLDPTFPVHPDDLPKPEPGPSVRHNVLTEAAKVTCVFCSNSGMWSDAQPVSEGPFQHHERRNVLNHRPCAATKIWKLVE